MKIIIPWHELGCLTNYDEPMTDAEVEKWSDYFEQAFRNWFEARLASSRPLRLRWSRRPGVPCLARAPRRNVIPRYRDTE